MIRREITDAVMDAVKHVLVAVTGITAEIQRVQPVTQISPHREVCIGIGFEGGAEGGVYLILDQQAAGRIAAKMDGSEETPGESVINANLMELVNMIAGNSVGLLAKAGVIISITPPASIDSPPPTPYGAECEVVFLQTGLGTVKVGLVFAEIGEG